MKRHPTGDIPIDLIKLAGGDVNEFRILYEARVDAVYSLGMRLCKSPILAEELTQEVFARIWQYRSRLNDVQNFNAYLSQIVRNQAFSILKRLAQEQLVLTKKDSTEFQHPVADNSFNADHTLLRKEHQATITAVLSQLTKKQKDVFVLCVIQGFSLQDAADLLGISKVTVKSHLQVARRKAKEILRDTNLQ